MSEPRVVSLLPSATEICYALGVEPVGVSHECDYPPAATDRPRVNTCKVDPDADSASINEQVEDAEAEGGVYEIRRDLLRELDPDYVITQGVCDVCAVDSVLVADVLAEMELDAEIVTTDPHSLADVFDDVERIGGVLGREERAAEVVADLRERVEAVEERVADADRTPRTVVCDWMHPPMVAGHWMPDVVERAGGEYGLTAPGAHSEPIDFAAIVDFDPEVFVSAPCGFELDQALAHREELTGRDRWGDLTAVQDERVYAMDGHHFVNRPGPRLVDTVEYVAALLHPALFEAPPEEHVRAFGRPLSRA